MPHPTPIEFAAQLVTLIDEASTTTTYKFALLLALIDLCNENLGASEGCGPRGSVTTRQVAERVLGYYWPQAQRRAGSGEVLRQIGDHKKRSIVDQVSEFCDGVGDGLATTIHRARLADPKGWTKLVDSVEWTLIRYPIPLLQIVNKVEFQLIYRINWDCRVSRGSVRSGAIDNRILFLPGAEESLATLAGIFRPLIRREWARFVANCNGLAHGDLESRLFDAERENLSQVREPLVRLQRGLCFYCSNQLRAETQVDHFLPWSRCAENAIENLVGAHPKCNQNKSHHMADTRHVRRWVARMQKGTPACRELEDIARDNLWESARDRTLNTARSLYGHLPASVPLWISGKDFGPRENDELAAVLG